MKIAIAQINPTVGDIAGNAAKIMHYYAKATDADLVVCPELSLIGYPPEDLVLMPSFRAEAMRAAHDLAAKTAGGAALLIGSVWEQDDTVFNAALLLDGGKIVHVQPKTMLPNYGIFDEKRLFAPGAGPQVTMWRGMKLGILICEDMWYSQTAKSLAEQGAQLLVVINASPFEAGKLASRKEVARAAVAQAGVPLVYANMVGGQDDIVFDGGSFVIAGDGALALQMEEFAEAFSSFVIPDLIGDLEPRSMRPEIPAFAGMTSGKKGMTSGRKVMTTEETLWNAMALGLRDYVRKNGFSGVTLGLSGGIDSAVSAAVSVDALGAKNVTGVLLPSPYTSKQSIEDALETAKLLGIETMNIPITPGMNVLEEVLSPAFKEAGWMDNVAIGGNVQARLRGLTLMALTNRFGGLLLSTGNKSEIAVGYSTLYGDSCGGYNVLKDLYKTQVYALAHWRNASLTLPLLGGGQGGGYVIPKNSIERAPSAELAPGQTDQDQLPPYDMLDAILAYHLEGRLGARDIIAKGFAHDIVEKILKMVRINEYKRRQSCPGVKLSGMMFGRDRRYPLTNKF